MVLTFAVPAVTEGCTPIMGVRLAQVRHWLSGLPVADMDSSAQLLCQGYAQLNRCRVDPGFHLEALQVLHGVVQEVVQGLRERYATAPLPLSGRAQKRAQLVHDLLQEQCYGWKIVLLKQQPGTHRGYSGKALARLAYPAMQAMIALALEQYAVYRPLPADYWAELNRLYLFSVQHNIHAIPLSQNKSDEEDSIYLLYLQMLLLAVINPYRLVRCEVDKVFRLLRTWRQHGALIRPPEHWLPAGELVVDPAGSGHPYNCFCLPRQDINTLLMIDVIELQKMVRQQLIRLHAVDAGVRQPNALAMRMQRDLFMRLAGGWGQQSERSGERVACARHIEMVVGLLACHKAITLADKSESEGEAIDEDKAGNTKIAGLALVPKEIELLRGRGSPGPIPALTTASKFGIDDPGRDLWAYSTVVERMSAEQQIDFLAKDALDSILVTQANESRGGWLLSFDRLASANLRVGELLGIKIVDDTAPAVSRWQLGTVRWMQFTAAQSGLVGVMLVTDRAIPLQVKAMSGVGLGGGFTRALLIGSSEEIAAEGRIIVSAAIFDVDTILAVEHHDAKIRIRLKRLLESTESYACFDYRLL